MTTQRRDDNSTPFGIWLRKQHEIDSKLGFITSDIDFSDVAYIWKNYKTNEWMLFEEKTYDKIPTKSQMDCLSQLDRYLRKSKLYRGYFVIVFEKSTPDNGKIQIGRVENKFNLNLQPIGINNFISFLRFESDL